MIHLRILFVFSNVDPYSKLVSDRCPQARIGNSLICCRFRFSLSYVIMREDASISFPNRSEMVVSSVSLWRTNSIRPAALFAKSKRLFKSIWSFHKMINQLSSKLLIYDFCRIYEKRLRNGGFLVEDLGFWGDDCSLGRVQCFSVARDSVQLFGEGFWPSSWCFSTIREIWWVVPRKWLRTRDFWLEGPGFFCIKYVF